MTEISLQGPHVPSQLVRHRELDVGTLESISVQHLDPVAEQYN